MTVIINRCFPSRRTAIQIAKPTPVFRIYREFWMSVQLHAFARADTYCLLIDLAIGQASGRLTVRDSPCKIEGGSVVTELVI